MMTIGCDEMLYASWAFFAVYVALSVAASALSYKHGIIDGYFNKGIPPVQRVVDEELERRWGPSN